MSSLTQYRNLIDGKLRAPESGNYLDALNPATGELWARIPASGQDDVNAAVAAAAAAQPGWATLPQGIRGNYLERAADVIRSHAAELAELETADNGNLLSVNKVVNELVLPPTLNRAGNDALAAATGQSAVLDHTTIGYTRREPYGVVAAIIPFNMPVAMFVAKASVALAGGNTVVVKSPEQASVGMLRLGELLAEVFPPGVVNIISGAGDVGDALVRHRHVDKVTMTGSSATARLIQAATAETLTPAVFELGGKSPNIVFADADLDAAAMGLTIPSVYNFNAGQACVAGTRMLIQRPVFDDMLDRIKSIVASIVIGDPADAATMMGPLISQAQLDRVARYIEIGKKEADLLFGGRTGAEVVPQLPGGYWAEPTLFLTSDNSTQICQDEIFGPVASIIPFDTEEEAVAIANDSRYGLASGVWTQDVSRAHRMIRDIRSGNVWVNTYMQIRYELPFGGFKDSGYGHDTVLDFTREKTAVLALGSEMRDQNPIPIPTEG
jgi:aldehyde dehydrogenase (NAD+)